MLNVIKPKRLFRSLIHSLTFSFVRLTLVSSLYLLCSMYVSVCGVELCLPNANSTARVPMSLRPDARQQPRVVHFRPKALLLLRPLLPPTPLLLHPSRRAHRSWITNQIRVKRSTACWTKRVFSRVYTHTRAPSVDHFSDGFRVV